MTRSSPGRKSLEDWQRQTYQSLGLSPPVLQDLELLIESLAQKWTRQLYPKVNSTEIEAYSRRRVEEIRTLLTESPPTRFEELSRYVNILLIARQLEESAQNSSDGPVLTRPIFGTVPLGGVSALTMLEGTEYIVAFSSGLFSFAKLMGRCVAKTLQYTGVSQGLLPQAPEQPFYGFSLNTDDIRESLRRDPASGKSFTEAVLSYVRSGRPDTSHLPELDPVREFFASIVYRYFLEFVVAHEYGHIFHKHLMDQRTSGIPEGTTTARTIMWNWKQEGEADVAACGLMFARARTRPIDLASALMGIDLFLSCYETLDRAVSVLTVGDEEFLAITAGHPPARTRRGFIYYHLLSRAHEFLEGANAEAQMRSALKEAFKLSQVVDVLWEQAHPYLWRLYEVGSKPAPIFKQVSDSQLSRDAAMLGEVRPRLKKFSPDAAGTLERTETLVVSGKGLMRASAAALLKEESVAGMTQSAIAEAHAAIDASVKAVGSALADTAQALSRLRAVLAKSVVGAPPDQYQTAVEKIVLAGAQLESAGLSKARAIALHEGARRIREVGQLLYSMGEMSGVGVHLMHTGECLASSSEALARDELTACWRATKVAGAMAVLSGECLIRGSVELWRVLLLPATGGLLLMLADALREDRMPHLGMLRDLLSLYKEAQYALVASLRRSSSFFRNVEPLPPDIQAKFTEGAREFKLRADALSHVAGRVADAESVLDRPVNEGGGQARIEETGRILETVADTLREAVIREQQLGVQSSLKNIADVLSSGGRYLSARDPARAALLMEEFAAKFLVRRY
jgi:hypothetical protein